MLRWLRLLRYAAHTATAFRGLDVAVALHVFQGLQEPLDAHVEPGCRGCGRESEWSNLEKTSVIIHESSVRHAYPKLYMLTCRPRSLDHLAELTLFDPPGSFSILFKAHRRTPCGCSLPALIWLRPQGGPGALIL